METKELKFLLKLLGCSNYRASLSGSVFKTFKGKDKICRNLGDRNLVDFSREIATVKILSPGQALLKLDPAELPITDQERKVLEKLSKTSGKIIPSKITSLKAAERDTTLKTLSDRGLIEVELKIKRTKAEVWLTERGIEYLRDDYSPKGAATIRLDLLNNYVRFLRKTLKVKPEQVSTSAVHSTESGVETIINITDEEILQTIQKLDKELGTDNYLPIFHLRQKLQPPLTRDELDKALYRLQRNDQIEFSTLLDPKPYTPEQVDAGIQQNVGGSLFFISVN
ncbi:transcription factor RcaD [Fischerella thermalis]|jgi:trehalose-6-phosphate synthase|uniref:transcription factor RcaD n=1 Tax=Fischerella thermalis TaxID=372787 RepID=UPI000C7F85C8|nr:transcription factor RcaD [Fischerella thermalis]PLZ07085.1 transcription factor RcaD [Fischerella thermalis WC114]PLZ11362.1 transcription factor RcaD [Fischerella thermalis WC119]PLZ17383.1 transcription factor RcaD [Fischerella thermalis WC157]PLZ65125.1 transcription factor RcaD [Fischerella thermalis WC246]PLZ79170.1 transcription factor RcaD [Fischerella thermalis WC245]